MEAKSCQSAEYGCPRPLLGEVHDKVFDSKYRHKHQDTVKCDICNACCTNADPVCESAVESSCLDLGCNDDEFIHRDQLQWQREARDSRDNEPPALAIHVGGIGSADTVLKSGETRDQLAKRDNVIGFEMEGAGVWDELPSCMIIKGVCDYADSHKSKGWQRYAAATAASTAKALLGKYFTNRQSKSPKQHRIFSVPFAENDSFVGRDNVIKSLMDMLFAKRKGRVALVCMGGVGKTQVVLRVAYMIQEKEPARSVLWLPAFSMAAFELACMDLVEKLNLPRNKDNNDGRELIQQHLSLESIGRWLLILDNADSEEVMHGCEGVPGIFAYLPRSQHGQVLVGSNK